MMRRLLIACSTVLLFVAPVWTQQPSAPSQPPTTQAPAQSPAAPTSVPSCPEMASALQRLLSNDARLRDWPQLARYRESNRLLAPPAAGEARVVFMGDSITDLWQQPRFGGFFPGKPYIDRGISGQTTPQMLLRFRPDVIDLKPKAVVILAGTNDIAGNTGPLANEEIEGNLESMSELAQAHRIRVVLASILPTSAYHTTPGGIPQTALRPLARIIAVNDWMKAYAAAHNQVYLDYFSAMVDSTGVLREEFSADDLHPNAQGYAVMAPLAQAAIERALK
jgi:lysophospholipase L1-like esterase